MRQLATDLVEDFGLTLGDFDGLAQLGRAGGDLRISELVAQAYSSRSGITRRIDRWSTKVWSREPTDVDGRGVGVGVTDAGVARLAEAAPAHLRRVRELRDSATASSLAWPAHSRTRRTPSLPSCCFRGKTLAGSCGT